MPQRKLRVNRHAGPATASAALATLGGGGRAQALQSTQVDTISGMSLSTASGTPACFNTLRTVAARARRRR
eukprot:12574479-Alexandrium_andersonii.AAC.1